MTEPRLSFKEMCARFDVTPRTLRYYEYIELLAPEKEGRARFYGPREMARMKLILRGRRFGFSLEEIRQLLDLYYVDNNQMTQLREVLLVGRRHLDEMLAQRTALDEAIAELTAQLDSGSEQLAALEASRNAAE